MLRPALGGTNALVFNPHGLGPILALAPGTPALPPIDDVDALYFGGGFRPPASSRWPSGTPIGWFVLAVVLGVGGGRTLRGRNG